MFSQFVNIFFQEILDKAEVDVNCIYVIKQRIWRVQSILKIYVESPYIFGMLKLSPLFIQLWNSMLS